MCTVSPPLPLFGFPESQRSTKIELVEYQTEGDLWNNHLEDAPKEIISIILSFIDLEGTQDFVFHSHSKIGLMCSSFLRRFKPSLNMFSTHH